MQVSRSELILGGQKSGKSRRAELLARDWLAQSPAHHALLIETRKSQTKSPMDPTHDFSHRHTIVCTHKKQFYKHY